MRVLIPYPANPDSFQDNVAHTLSKMGHDVRVAPKSVLPNSWKPVAALRRFARDVWPSTWDPCERFCVEAAREWQPDVVLCLTQTLNDEVLEALAKIGIRNRVAWWGDAPGNMQKFGLLSPWWTSIYIKDWFAVQKFQAVGINAQLLHEAMNPEWHKPTGESVNDSVAVVGNCYGYRQYQVNRLLAAGLNVRLFGPGPPRWASAHIRSLHEKQYVVKTRKSQIFEGAVASLNSTSFVEGDSLNCRAFEICGARGLQLLESRPCVAMCFEPGSEVLVYKSLDEVVEYVNRARSDKSWAERIRERGRARALAHHTYENRLKNIVQNLI
jgi:spore maturation protein CgeB